MPLLYVIARNGLRTVSTIWGCSKLINPVYLFALQSQLVPRALGNATLTRGEETNLFNMASKSSIKRNYEKLAFIGVARSPSHGWVTKVVNLVRPTMTSHTQLSLNSERLNWLPDFQAVCFFCCISHNPASLSIASSEGRIYGRSIVAHISGHSEGDEAQPSSQLYSLTLCR